MAFAPAQAHCKVKEYSGTRAAHGLPVGNDMLISQHVHAPIDCFSEQQDAAPSSRHPECTTITCYWICACSRQHALLCPPPLPLAADAHDAAAQAPPIVEGQHAPCPPPCASSGSDLTDSKQGPSLSPVLAGSDALWAVTVAAPTHTSWSGIFCTRWQPQACSDNSSGSLLADDAQP